MLINDNQKYYKILLYLAKNTFTNVIQRAKL
jgi:hypothetical protein